MRRGRRSRSPPSDAAAHVAKAEDAAMQHHRRALQLKLLEQENELESLAAKYDALLTASLHRSVAGPRVNSKKPSIVTDSLRFDGEGVGVCRWFSGGVFEIERWRLQAMQTPGQSLRRMSRCAISH